MLGRVRRCSLSSLEGLEMERTPCKIIKDDSLSIYESTLMKLKQGSRRHLSLTPEQSAKIDTSQPMASISSDEALMTEYAPDYSSTDSFQSSSDCQSISISNEQLHGNLSVLYLFSRYKSSQNGNLSSPEENAMAIEIGCSSASTSPSHSSDGQLFSSTRNHLEQECGSDHSLAI